MCKKPGDECERPAQMYQHRRLCAEACRRCEHACRQLLSAINRRSSSSLTCFEDEARQTLRLPPAPAGARCCRVRAKTSRFDDAKIYRGNLNCVAGQTRCSDIGLCGKVGRLAPRLVKPTEACRLDPTGRCP